MSPELRQQYLQAMGIQLWQSRYQAEPESEIAIEFDTAIQPQPVTSDVGEIQQKEMPSDWLVLENTINTCVACELSQSRTQAVIAEGNNSARLMIISTAPVNNIEPTLLTAESSQLFSKMLKAIEIELKDIYFTSLVKCQLPEDRELRTTEVLCCEQYLSQQIEKVNPDLIVALGEFSAQQLVVSKKPLQELRGKVYQYHSIPLMVMSHPDSLLANPQDKRQAWHDLLQIKQKLNG
jgi:uracil-DNA glycosylase